MNKQINLSFFSDELKEVKTHKKEFLEQIERIIPWGELEELVRPCYYEGKRGNKPYDLELMLRIHLLPTTCPTKALEMRSSTAGLFRISAVWNPAIRFRTATPSADSATCS